MPNPIASVIPGALNFSQASRKLMPQTNPTQVKMQAIATGCSTLIIAMELMDYSCNSRSWKET